MKKVKKPCVLITTIILFGVVVFALWFYLQPKGGKVKGQADIYGQEGSWSYAYCGGWDKCVLLSWQWDGNTDNMTIEVPESLAGRMVVSLGQENTTLGSFEVLLPADYTEGINVETQDADCVREDDSYETYVFHIILNDGIEYVNCEDAWYGCMDEEDPEDEPDYVYKLAYILE